MCGGHQTQECVSAPRRGGYRFLYCRAPSRKKYRFMVRGYNHPHLHFGYPGGLKWGPCTSLTRCSLGCTPKCPIDTGLAELGTPYDFRDGRTVFQQGFHLLNYWE